MFIDEKGEVLKRFPVSHTLDGFDRICEKASKAEPDPAQILIGIEHHEGALPAFLLARNFTVYPINPKSVQRARDSIKPSGSKDDKLDALVIADLVRTSACRFRSLGIGDELVNEIESRLKTRAWMVRERTRKILRLDALLAEWAPDPHGICKGFESKWKRDLLVVCPLRQDFSGISMKRLDAFLKAHRLAEKTRSTGFTAKCSPRTAPFVAGTHRQLLIH